jgi:hypothetical protein
MDTSSGRIGSWCTTRVCAGSVVEVAALLRRRLAEDPRFSAGVASLELVSTAASPVATVGPPRVHRAWLRYSRWRPAARVTLEIERWSTEESEVLVRPSRRLPRAEDAYFAAALALVDAVVVDLERRALGAVSEPRATGDGLRRAS